MQSLSKDFSNELDCVSLIYDIKVLKEKVEFLISQNPYYTSWLESLPPSRSSQIENDLENDSKYQLEESDHNFFLRKMKIEKQGKVKETRQWRKRKQSGYNSSYSMSPNIKDSKKEVKKESLKATRYDGIFQIMKANHLGQ